jgi:hypothetical protein
VRPPANHGCRQGTGFARQSGPFTHQPWSFRERVIGSRPTGVAGRDYVKTLTLPALVVFAARSHAVSRRRYWFSQSAHVMRERSPFSASGRLMRTRQTRASISSLRGILSSFTGMLRKRSGFSASG